MNHVRKLIIVALTLHTQRLVYVHLYLRLADHVSAIGNPSFNPSMIRNTQRWETVHQVTRSSCIQTYSIESDPTRLGSSSGFQLVFVELSDFWTVDS